MIPALQAKLYRPITLPSFFPSIPFTSHPMSGGQNKAIDMPQKQ